ncbi:hypothetical protein QA601_13685 [Chitinispirillales bacterium ANBcel5]|uniref:hypothetical protein n=1 Tax=Cellulosispirillum alkaliphilum TaxID=3039283 RepID=UPI002A51DFE2|nr:hypothetical protein [Chitinispirillales bacterium ANBcel5]
MAKEAQILEEISQTIADLQIKYRRARLNERMQLKPALDELIKEYENYQHSVLKRHNCVSGENLEEMRAIRKEIENAADTQKLIALIARTVTAVIKKF